METPSNSEHSFNEGLSVKIANVMRIVYYDEIVYLEGDDYYTYLSLVTKQRCLICKSLKKFEKKLCTSRFIRCHKSFIINRSFIKEIRLNKETKVCLTTGDLIPVSRRRLSDLRKCFKE